MYFVYGINNLDAKTQSYVGIYKSEKFYPLSDLTPFRVGILTESRHNTLLPSIRLGQVWFNFLRANSMVRTRQSHAFQTSDFRRTLESGEIGKLIRPTKIILSWERNLNSYKNHCRKKQLQRSVYALFHYQYGVLIQYVVRQHR